MNIFIYVLSFVLGSPCTSAVIARDTQSWVAAADSAQSKRRGPPPGLQKPTLFKCSIVDYADVLFIIIIIII